MTQFQTLNQNLPAMNQTYISEMALTAAELLNIDISRRNVALLMGCPVTMNNLQALEDWIYSRIQDFAYASDFVADVLPELARYLRQCRCELEASITHCH